jgi:hypothetical protein
MRILTYIFIIIIFSCGQRDSTNASLNELIQTVRENNNYTLSLYRDGNILLKKIQVSAIEEADENLDRIDKLLKLNNTMPTDYNLLSEFIIQNNLKSNSNCKISNSIRDVTNEIEYYNELNRIIKEACISPGSINQPRMLMNYTVAGNTFRVRKGDKLEIPLKAFPQQTFGKFEYVLFDTLNFKANSYFDGYYNIGTDTLQLGTQKERFNVYGKDIYSGLIEHVGSIECEITVYE